MKKTGLVLTTVAVCLVAAICVTGSADAATESSSASFPSVSEIFSTIQFPDYTFETFMNDFQYVFSSDMMSEMGTYLGHLGTFLVEDTFLGGDPDSSSFSTDDGYVNIFVLLALIIAILCVIGAVITYLVNRKTYRKAREFT